MISKKYNAVTKSRTCDTVEKDVKGGAKYDPVSYKFDPIDSRAAETIYQTAFDSQTAEISVRASFAKRAGETTPDILYFTAQVAAFAYSAGGAKDDIDMREVELWIQRDLTAVAGT